MDTGKRCVPYGKYPPWEEQAMETKKYFIVSADALPEVFVKVAEAKRMLQVGEAGTEGQAAAMVGISRSAFYK